MISCYTCTAGHTALLVFAHNRTLFTRVWFPWLQCICQQVIINWVVALQLVAWALLGNHSTQCMHAMGVPVAIVRVLIMAVIGTPVYRTHYMCNSCTIRNATLMFVCYTKNPIRSIAAATMISIHL